MKKVIVGAALVAVVAVMGIQTAHAYRGAGGPGAGNGPGCQFQTLDAESQKKHDEFLAATKELRKTLVTKQTQKMALMRGENPDPAKAAQLSGEIFDLREQVRAKAREAGVSDCAGGMGMGRMAMSGPGGCGKRGGGHGMRGGWGM